MIKKNHGHAVIIASMTSFVSLGGSIDYCCSKASARAFHEGLSQELSLWYDAPKVRTSIFHPSWGQRFRPQGRTYFNWQYFATNTRAVKC